MKVLFRCRHCFLECSADTESEKPVICRSCRKPQSVQFTDTELQSNLVDVCVICHQKDFYVRDDVRKGLGLLYLVAGLAGAFFTYGISLLPAGWGFYWHFLKYSRVTVCYHCYAKYRNARRNPTHREYDSKTGETLDQQIRNDRTFPGFR